MISLEKDIVHSDTRAKLFGAFLDSLGRPIQPIIEVEARPERPPTKVEHQQARREKVGHRARLLARIIARDGESCCYCHKPLGDDWTLEHRVAQASGGGDDLDNCALAHAKCNQQMRDLPPAAKDAAAQVLRNVSNRACKE